MRGILFLLLFAPPVAGQVIQATNCVYREGDDPAWARPGYDDSGWQKAARRTRDNLKDELFGFERTAAISARSAHEIAEADRAWGQNDDITVVTVRRDT